MKIWSWIKSKLPKRKETVYFRVILDAPFPEIGPQEPQKPWVRVIGVSEEKAQGFASLDWNTIPHALRRQLEQEPFCLEVKWDEISRWMI